MLEDKLSLRRHFLTIRLMMKAEDHADKSQRCCENLVRYLQEHGLHQKTIATYLSIRGEVDMSTALELFTKFSFSTALPVIEIENDPLVFCAWKKGDRLVEGAYGIAEPQNKFKKLVPDIVLVPLVAFDRRGHRLGYGGGYYDKTLPQLREANPDACFIGIGFAEQEHSQIPTEPHDSLLDTIITDREVIRISVVS